MGSPSPERIRRTALVLAGWVQAASDYTDGKLYDAGHFHSWETAIRNRDSRIEQLPLPVQDKDCAITRSLRRRGSR